MFQAETSARRRARKHSAHERAPDSQWRCRAGPSRSSPKARPGPGPRGTPRKPTRTPRRRLPPEALARSASHLLPGPAPTAPPPRVRPEQPGRQPPNTPQAQTQLSAGAPGPPAGQPPIPAHGPGHCKTPGVSTRFRAVTELYLSLFSANRALTATPGIRVLRGARAVIESASNDSGRSGPMSDELAKGPARLGYPGNSRPNAGAAAPAA